MTRLIRSIALAVVAASPLFAANLWEDRSLRIIQTVETNFPPGLLMDGIREGRVRAVLHVDENGKLLDCLVTGFTHEAFARELLTQMSGWQFEPARQRGETVSARAEVMFAFEARGQVISVQPGQGLTTSTGDWGKTPLQSLLCRLSDLDTPPKLVHVVQPDHPGRRLQPPELRGSATVDFYIDGEGRTRMPVVTRASHEVFGAAAATALSQWRFAPPTCAGRPVLVRATQQFTFSEKSAAGGGSGPVAFARNLRSSELPSR
jgi:TonB family protein